MYTDRVRMQTDRVCTQNTECGHRQTERGCKQTKCGCRQTERHLDKLHDVEDLVLVAVVLHQSDDVVVLDTAQDAHFVVNELLLQTAQPLIPVRHV